jgi:hypothetical protein
MASHLLTNDALYMSHPIHEKILLTSPLFPAGIPSPAYSRVPEPITPRTSLSLPVICTLPPARKEGRRAEMRAYPNSANRASHEAVAAASCPCEMRGHEGVSGLRASRQNRNHETRQQADFEDLIVYADCFPRTNTFVHLMIWHGHGSLG